MFKCSGCGCGCIFRCVVFSYIIYDSGRWGPSCSELGGQSEVVSSYHSDVFIFYFYFFIAANRPLQLPTDLKRRRARRRRRRTTRRTQAKLVFKSRKV